jgi:hypothetical protein
MSIELKIKSKHLSEEACIIRFEEHKLKKKIDYKKRKHKAAGHNDPYEHWKDIDHRKRSSLNHHRRWDVRNENRATFLARAYIAGVPYNQVEQKRIDEVLFNAHIIPRVCSMVVKYGNRKDGDWNWDKQKNKYVATKQLKDKIIEWSKI